MQIKDEVYCQSPQLQVGGISMEYETFYKYTNTKSVSQYNYIFLYSSRGTH